jgi:sulfonate transport system ATP-binding protein
VRVNGLRRTFDGREVLAGVDVEVRSGEFVALLGRSGSGKSTLLRILAGLDDGATGDIHRPERRSVVFQDPRLLPWAKVIDNVVLGQRGDASRTAAREALHEVGLIGLEHAWPATLSGGEAQRVALARALIREPELLLLDEPFGALDALTRIKMHGLVRQLCERHRPAVLLVTHDVDEAIVLADRVLVLVDGAIAVDRDTHSHFGVEALGAARPRRHGSPEFAELRSDLLAHLGVTDL